MKTNWNIQIYCIHIENLVVKIWCHTYRVKSCYFKCRQYWLQVATLIVFVITKFQIPNPCMQFLIMTKNKNCNFLFCLLLVISLLIVSVVFKYSILDKSPCISSYNRCKRLFSFLNICFRWLAAPRLCIVTSSYCFQFNVSYDWNK